MVNIVFFKFYIVLLINSLVNYAAYFTEIDFFFSKNGIIDYYSYR